ncbi:monocarboxylate transporter 12-like [Haliotis cracherodii]|uniref:monocarboxylate transporter 12-like n=1 Tax=Haliotis cracherodii TaxID=6455 RepID=UPI0039ED68FC
MVGSNTNETGNGQLSADISRNRKAKAGSPMYDDCQGEQLSPGSHEGRQPLEDHNDEMLLAGTEEEQGLERDNEQSTQLVQDNHGDDDDDDDDDGDKGEVKIDVEEKPCENSDDYGFYKWIVVLGCFFQHFLTGGFERSDGVLYLKLISKFNQSAQATAWVGSLASTIRLMLGPLSSAFSNRFSSRVATMIGGLFMTVGVLISGFAPNLIFLYFSYGVIGGIGRSLSYAPGLVTVGQYFAKKPGLAVGLATSGVGAGTFVIPPLADFLFDEFNFMGAFLILSGLSLNLLVSGALYRPLDLHKKIMSVQRRKERRTKRDSTKQAPSETHPREDVELLLTHRHRSNKDTPKEILPDQCTRNYDGHNYPETTATDHVATVTDHVAVSTDHVATVTDHVAPLRALSVDNTSSTSDKRPSWCGIFTKCVPEKKEKKTKLLELSLLKNPPFLMFCISIALFTLSFKSAFTFLPALAKSQGCTEREAALLMSISGVLDTIGRILTGFVLDFKSIRQFRPYIYNGVMFVIATLSFVCPSLDSFWQFCVLCGLYGALSGAYVSQKSVIIVDILGVDKLSSSFGLMICFQGLGTLIGPPVSGVFRDVFGDYTLAFYFGGAMIILAGIIMIFSNMLLAVQRRKQAEVEAKKV